MRKLLFSTALLALAVTSCNEFDIPSTPVTPPQPFTPDVPDAPTVTIGEFTPEELVLTADGNFNVAFTVSASVENAAEGLQWGLSCRFADDADWTQLYAESDEASQTFSYAGVLPASLLDEDWALTVQYRPCVVIEDVLTEGAVQTATAQWTPVITVGEATEVTTESAVVAAHAEGFDFSGEGTEAAVVVLYGTTEGITAENATIVEVADAEPGDFTVALAELAAGTAYYYRAAFRIGERYLYSESEASFTTEAVVEPEPEPEPTVYDVIYISGDFNDWGNTAMTPVNTTDNHEWTYLLDATGNDMGVKFKTETWEVNWGSTDFPAGIGEQNGANISVPGGFKYLVTFNDLDGSYQFEQQEPEPEHIVRKWTFSNWSEETIANLAADDTWTGDEKGNGTIYEGAYWYNNSLSEELLYANGSVIGELNGLKFKREGKKGIAIATDYQVTKDGNMWGPYHGAQYLWIAGRFTEIIVESVAPGTTIKAGVESHKPSDKRGLDMYINDVKYNWTSGQAGYPDSYDEYTWKVPENIGSDNVDVVFKASNGCHIYFLNAE